jgi:aspartate racemase
VAQDGHPQLGITQPLINLVAERLGGYHSAKILLKSNDYHDIITHYGTHHDTVGALLKHEFQALIDLKPDSIIICCNSLHKYYDMIKAELNTNIPVMHAIELVTDQLNRSNHKTALCWPLNLQWKTDFLLKF